MATTLLPLSFTVLFLLFTIQAQAHSYTAPAPAGPVNLTEILDKYGQFTIFIDLLATTQVANKVEIQLNSSTEGLTVFAPADSAFLNLQTSALNSLSQQQQVELVLYHILPKFYTLSYLLVVSNPVRTQATGQDGGAFTLNFTGQGNQVSVSTGVVETQINNPLTQDFPLAVYQVDKVLLPEELFGVKSPTASHGPPSKSDTTGVASQPSSPPVGSGGRRISVGLGFVIALGVLS